MRRYNRFENLAQLHAAVETRLSRRLSATEWRMIAPAWVAPYDLSDLKEILQRAKDLPASRQERIRSLRRDVERLRTQLPAYEPRRMHGSPTLGGLTGFGRLYQYVAVGDDDDSDAESVNLLSLYCAIGRMFHEALAVDWLAKRYGLMPSTAQAFLMGLIDAEMAEGITAVSRPSYLRTLSAILPKVGPGAARAFELGFRQGVKRARRGLTDTDIVMLEVTEQARSVFGPRADWLQLWEVYEGARLRCLREPSNFPEGLRSFGGWRAFRVALKRAERRAAQRAPRE
jgi:hypothetical protein